MTDAYFISKQPGRRVLDGEALRTRERSITTAADALCIARVVSTRGHQVLCLGSAGQQDQNVNERARFIPIRHGHHELISRRERWTGQLGAIQLVGIGIGSERVRRTVAVDDGERAAS